ncbi:helix-turn-helix domain-containing protein [Vallitalea okinawensis]|uniref:helix-turn-helix domain-containing protein n=1 Tax=Vallitalea okinawensis TaxID=2078660 RepID=UPI000CFDF330|nr:XRE family transcriptional regulator [Vallitalea okinawensis]
MEIGKRLKELRIMNNLTQEELADRAELSKGFISQMENDLTSPSIATLTDLLQCLGTNLKEFFNEAEDEQIIFKEEDFFVKEYEDSRYKIEWIVPNAQKNMMEPIIVEMEVGGETENDNPHEGEEFGYVIQGTIYVYVGRKRFKAKKGETFYFTPTKPHKIINAGKTKAKFLWITTPPNF